MHVDARQSPTGTPPCIRACDVKGPLWCPINVAHAAYSAAAGKSLAFVASGLTQPAQAAETLVNPMQIMTSQTFEFIVIDETGKPEGGLKRKVRSHSSRAGWARHSRPDTQRLRQKRRKRPCESTTYIGTEQPCGESTSTPMVTPSSNPSEALVLDRRFGGVRLDPFQAYPPVRWASFIPSLVDHCK